MFITSFPFTLRNGRTVGDDVWTREDLRNHVKSRGMPSINYQFSVWWIFLRGPGEGAAFGRCSGQDVSGVRQVAERGLL